MLNLIATGVTLYLGACMIAALMDAVIRHSDPVERSRGFRGASIAACLASLAAVIIVLGAIWS